MAKVLCNVASELYDFPSQSLESKPSPRVFHVNLESSSEIRRCQEDINEQPPAFDDGRLSKGIDDNIHSPDLKSRGAIFHVFSIETIRRVTAIDTSMR